MCRSIPWNLSVDQFREVEDIDCQVRTFSNALIVLCMHVDSHFINMLTNAYSVQMVAVKVTCMRR